MRAGFPRKTGSRFIALIPVIDVLPRAAVRADKDPHPARVGLPRVERGAGAGFVHIKGGREDKHLVGIVAVGPVLVLARHVVPGVGDLRELREKSFFMTSIAASMSFCVYISEAMALVCTSFTLPPQAARASSSTAARSRDRKRFISYFSFHFYGRSRAPPLQAQEPHASL